MRSPECDIFLQRRLDGAGAADPDALELHLTGCPDCRKLHQAAQLLEEGLHELPRPVPPPRLAGRIVSQILADRCSRVRRRWWILPVAAAACLLLTPLGLALLGIFGSRPADSGGPVARRQDQAKPPALAPALEHTVVEAGAAVTDLTDRLAHQTRRRAQQLLTAAAPLDVPAALPNLGTLQAPLDPAAQSLRQAGEGVSAGLETVTGSARRAVAYLVHEFSPLRGDS